MQLPTKISSHYKYTETINLKNLGIRKKIDVYLALDTQKKSVLIVYITQKSRFLQKDVDKIEEIITTIKNTLEKDIEDKIIHIESPLCSKAKTKLESQYWNIIL